MTHPTYTHPGANAQLLNISRALRYVNKNRKDAQYWRDKDLRVSALFVVAQKLAEHDVLLNRVILRDKNRDFESLLQARIDGMLTRDGAVYLHNLLKGQS